METIAVHPGKFHADDVFSSAVLKMIYPSLKIVRTRDPNLLNEVDLRVDVGGEYNPNTEDFDHHQATFTKTRPSGIPYASAGLIWEHYGKKLVDEEAWEIIDKKIVEYIDADDNGVRTHEAKEIEPYTFREIILSFNPEWPNKTKELYDKCFNEAVDFCIGILKREIELARTFVEIKKIIKNKIKQTDKEYLILDENIPFQDVVREESDKIKFVLKQDPVDKVWATIGVKKKKNHFEVRKEFPKDWAGLSDEDLIKVTGVDDAVFCHKKLFIAIAKSKEGAIKLTELALEN